MRKFALFSIIFLAAIFLSYSSYAATFNVPAGDVRALINAILSASKNSDEDIINLASNSTYNLNSVYEVFRGNNALPMLKGKITLNGNGATIRQANPSLRMRAIFIGTGANVVFNNIIFRDFYNGSEEGNCIRNDIRCNILYKNVKFINNQSEAKRGGAIYTTSSALRIENCEFIGNRTFIKGGAISNVLTNLTIVNTKFEDNQSTTTADNGDSAGGALSIDGALGDTGEIRIERCVFIRNACREMGGAVYLYLYNQQKAYIKDCEFVDNKTIGGSAFSNGGALVFQIGALAQSSNGFNNPVAQGEFYLENSTIHNNSCLRRGGGIWLVSGKLFIKNATIFNNRASISTGAVSMDAAELEIINSTIAGNTSPNTGGISLASASAVLKVGNTIFSDNTSETATRRHHFLRNTGTFIDLGNNLQFHSKDNNGGLPTTIRVANPLLLPLADNGGPTRTMALQKGSPAIDAGNNCTPTDQRGQRRIGQCDIGAFEYVPNTSADFTPNTSQNITTGQIITFQDASNNNPTAWEWTITGGAFTFVNGTNKNSQNPQVRFDSQGVFSVALTASNISNSDTKTVTNLVTVTSPLPKPIADFIPNTLQEITVGGNVKFYDRSKSNPTSWQWTVTGGRHRYIWNTSATSKDPRVQFDDVGIYTISMTVSNEAGSDTKTVSQMVRVNPPVTTPIADFSPSTAQTLTVGQSINFQDLSTNTPTAWEWTFTGGTVAFLNGTTRNSQHPQVRFDSEGKYSVALKSTNSAGSHTKTITEYITVNKAVTTPPPVSPTSPLAPIADFTPNTFQEITVGQHIKFYDRSKNSPTTWQWTVTGGRHKYIWNTSATFKDPRIQFDEVGLYTISMTVSNALGSDTKTITQMVKVNAATIAQQNILSPTLVTEPNISAPANLQININNTNQVNLQWQDNSKDHEGYKIYRKEEEKEAILIQTINKTNTEELSFNDQSKLTPDTRYDYYVVTFGKGIEKQSNLATVYTYPLKPNLDKIEYQCAENKYLVKINSLNPSPRYKKLHQWEGVAKTQLVEQNLLQIDASRDNKIKVIAIGKTGLESMPLEIDLVKREQPKAQIVGEIERKVCENQTLLSAEKVENAKYEWRWNGKAIENLKGSEVKVNQSGKYELVIKKDGCEFVSNPVQVTFFALKTPEIEAPNEVKFCKKGQMAIKEAQEGVKYQWLDEQNKIVGEGNSLTVEKTGTYKVVATSDLGCQKVSNPIQVSVGQPIVINTQIISPTCFNNDNGKIIISWQDAQKIKVKLGQEIKEGNTVSFEHLKAGVHHIVAETTYGCYKEMKVEIKNPEKFKINISENELTTNKFTPVQLQAEGKAAEYEWFPKEGLDNPYIANPKANPTQTTVYKVVGKNKNGCESSAEIKVNVIDTKQILPSKILSPNGDGVNDTWQIANIEFFPEAEVAVYNRFGQEVFHKIGYQNDWDGGNINSENALIPSTFYFVIKIPQNNKHISGSLTVMR